MKKILNFFRRYKEITVMVTVYIKQEEGVYYAYAPTMPGLHVEGETEAEVKEIVKEAVVAYLISLMKHNDPLPLGSIVKEPISQAEPYTFTQFIPAYA